MVSVEFLLVVAVGTTLMNWLLVAKLSPQVHAFADEFSNMLTRQEDSQRRRFIAVFDAIVGHEFELFENQTGLGLVHKEERTS
jgi:hypothetical protein